MDEASDERGTDEGYGHATDATSEARPTPGDIVIDPDLGIAPEPLVGSDASTPLAEGEDDNDIPPCPLWALKERRHVHWHLLASSERHERLRLTIGSGPLELHAIDDGKDHAQIGRVVGTAPGGVGYCLVGRVTREWLSQLSSSDDKLRHAFDEAAELGLVGVAVEEGIASSNVFDVEFYDDVAEIPEYFLPGAALNVYDSPLDIDEG